MKPDSASASFASQVSEPRPGAPAPNEAAETWEPISCESPGAEMRGASMDIDIACVGFGPAMGGFLTTLSQAWPENPSDPAFESKVMPGMPLQILCYERADDLAAGVSGVVTRARG